MSLEERIERADLVYQQLLMPESPFGTWGRILNSRSAVFLFCITLLLPVEISYCSPSTSPPLTKSGVRRRTIRTLFKMLRKAGYLYINETPNRLCPKDFDTTLLWWIPWTKPGSKWAYRGAVRKGRHSDVPTLSEAPLGLEERGAWGATYWEIKSYLKEEKISSCLNTLSGHDRHINYESALDWISGWKRSLFELLVYWFAVKLLRTPITAFTPAISSLVIKKGQNQEHRSSTKNIDLS